MYRWKFECLQEKKILKGHLVPYMNEGYIFQQDGAPAHTAASTLSLLRKNNIRLGQVAVVTSRPLRICQ